MREIAEALASSDEADGGGGAEQGAARNCGAFLLELTKELPKEMTAAIATLQPYLETDEVSIVQAHLLRVPAPIVRKADVVHFFTAILP